MEKNNQDLICSQKVKKKSEQLGRVISPHKIPSVFTLEIIFDFLLQPITN